MRFHLQKRRQLCHLLLEALMVFSGMMLLFVHMKVYDYILDEYFVLSPNSGLTKTWLYPKTILSVKLYFFNWTNPDQLTNKTVKPKFTEMGPYFYNEKYIKTDVVYNENDTISFRTYKTFHFVQEKSNGTEKDNITTLNVVPAIASHKAVNWNFFLKKGLSIALNSVPHHTTNEERKYIFEGYEDTFLSSAKYLPFIDDLPDMQKFAWFYKKNASTDYEGMYNVGTGRGNTTIANMYNWNYKTSGPYPGKCGYVQASTAEILPQNYNEKKLDIFNTDFCRVVTLDYTESTSFQGIDVNRYEGGISFLDSGTYDPGRSCLCSGKCQKFGVVDYSVCRYGVPIYLSFPHFYKADPSFRNNIEGMVPDQNKHNTFIEVNPRTGVVLNFSIAIQLNFHLEPNPDISLFRDVPDVMFPAVWFVVEGITPDEVIFQLKFLLWLPNILKLISFILMILGMLLAGYTLYVGKEKRSKEREKLKRSRTVAKPASAPEEQYFMQRMDVD